jgi:hypothetical protein
MDEHVKVGEIEIPVNYWLLSEDEKVELSFLILDCMATLLNEHLHSHINKVRALDKLIDSSIITNLQDEQYEIVDLLTKIRTMINEPIN